MDTEILSYAYERVLGQMKPWMFYQVRDARTLDTVETMLRIDRPARDSRVDPEHDAYADARYQARRVLAVFAALRDCRSGTDAGGAA
jgi:hypothetical protein